MLGMHLAEKSAQRWQFDFIEAQTRQVTISYLPYTGLTTPRVSGNQFEIIEVAQLLQITTFALVYTWRIFALSDCDRVRRRFPPYQRTQFYVG